MKLRLADYLDGFAAANTPDELEAAIRAPIAHRYHGRTWRRICEARIDAGERICAAHPHGVFVPRLGPGRVLSLCGQTYRVGRGGNSTGVRYCWHAAGEWAMALLRKHGFSVTAAHRLWDGWHDYPHRALAIVDAALAGRIPDPPLNVLIRHQRLDTTTPISLTVAANDADEVDRRASRPCECGGTLFDWGSGHSEGFAFVNWRCNACPDVFTEYMTQERLHELRSIAARMEPAQ
ncbi:MAG: hypothetical protein IBJ15_00230 [Alphaproteobacteria bacterium]|nr:hypothetical protein [Alphaproteobacteria bacterium]